MATLPSLVLKQFGRGPQWSQCSIGIIYSSNAKNNINVFVSEALSTNDSLIYPIFCVQYAQGEFYVQLLSVKRLHKKIKKMRILCIKKNNYVLLFLHI